MCKETKFLEETGYKKYSRSCSYKPDADLWQKRVVGLDDFFINIWHWDAIGNMGRKFEVDIQIQGFDGITRNVLWFGFDDLAKVLPEIEEEAKEMFRRFSEI